LLIFSPISGYIFGSLGRTATVGGASQIQILSARFTDTNQIQVDVKNLGPGTIPAGEWRIFVDGVDWGGITTTTTLPKDTTTTISGIASTGTVDTAKQHNIVVYGPGNTQAQYLYYPPPS
jgi:FlaG/FlaF family flagellin (archaellin)